MQQVKRRIHILDFDIENRPLTYLGGDWTTAEITAIAASFGLKDGVKVWLLGRDDPFEMLEGFRVLYDEANMVTGHYIRKHDLPIINGAMLEYGLPPLPQKLTCDTKLDLKDRHDISVSQESLAGMLGVKANKYHMTQPMWRSANRLEPEGLALAEKRVVGDVRQHQALRLKLAEQGMLNPPKVWRP